YGRNRFFNEFTPVVDDVERDAFRETLGDVFHLSLYGRDNFICIFSVAHHHYTTDNFTFAIKVEYAESGFAGHLDRAYIANSDRYYVDSLYRKSFYLVS